MKVDRFTEDFQQQLDRLQTLEDSSAFMELISKEEITFVIFIDGSDMNLLKFVTTSSDGFIKMNELNLEKNTYAIKKSFFVCNSGISVACQLSGQESFALAGKNNNVFIFSF
jgi:hypothetical protein